MTGGDEARENTTRGSLLATRVRARALDHGRRLRLGASGGLDERVESVDNGVAPRPLPRVLVPTLDDQRRVGPGTLSGISGLRPSNTERLISPAASPSNGTSRASISHSTTPNAYTSTFSAYGFFARSSGAM